MCQSNMCQSKTFFCMVCLTVLKAKHEAHPCKVEGYAFLAQ